MCKRPDRKRCLTEIEDLRDVVVGFWSYSGGFTRGHVLECLAVRCPRQRDGDVQRRCWPAACRRASRDAEGASCVTGIYSPGTPECSRRCCVRLSDTKGAGESLGNLDVGGLPGQVPASMREGDTVAGREGCRRRNDGLVQNPSSATTRATLMGLGGRMARLFGPGWRRSRRIQ